MTISEYLAQLQELVHNSPEVGELQAFLSKVDADDVPTLASSHGPEVYHLPPTDYIVGTDFKYPGDGSGRPLTVVLL